MEVRVNEGRRRPRPHRVRPPRGVDVSALRRGVLLVLVAGALAAVTSFGYLGGFLAPDADARGLPIAVVNLDRGAEVGATSLRFGDKVVDQLRAPNPALGDSVSWQLAPNREEIGRATCRERVCQYV